MIGKTDKPIYSDDVQVFDLQDAKLVEYTNFSAPSWFSFKKGDKRFSFFQDRIIKESDSLEEILFTFKKLYRNKLVFQDIAPEHYHIGFECLRGYKFLFEVGSSGVKIEEIFEEFR